MSKENRTYLNGKIKSWGVWGKDGAVYFTAECELETSQGKKTETAFINLIQRDGSINAHQRDALMAALDWDGKSLKSLAAKAAGWDKLDLRFTLTRDPESDNWSVSWINRRSSPMANPAALDEAEKQWQYLAEEPPF